MLLLDPTFLFLGPTLLVPLFASGDPKTHTLNLAPPTQADVLAYLQEPAVIACFVFIILGLLLGGKRSNRTAVWFLMNGGIVHIAMDGLTGGYHALPLMDKSYRQLDNRFNDDVSTGASHDAWAAAFLVVTLELFVMAPMCWLSYYAISNNKAWRQEISFMTAFLQFLGTIMFVFPEFITGCRNLSPFGFDGCLARFTSVPPGSTLEYHGLFFGFAVGANLIWLAVPLKLMINAWSENIEIKTGKVSETNGKRKAKIF